MSTPLEAGKGQWGQAPGWVHMGAAWACALGRVGVGRRGSSPRTLSQPQLSLPCDNASALVLGSKGSRARPVTAGASVSPDRSSRQDLSVRVHVQPGADLCPALTCAQGPCLP